MVFPMEMESSRIDGENKILLKFRPFGGGFIFLCIYGGNMKLRKGLRIVDHRLVQYGLTRELTFSISVRATILIRSGRFKETPSAWRPASWWIQASDIFPSAWASFRPSFREERILVNAYRYSEYRKRMNQEGRPPPMFWDRN